MATFDIKKYQNEIIKLNQEFADRFHKAAEKSRLEAMEGLKPGDTVPKTGIIYGDANRRFFEQEAGKIRDRGYAVIERARADLQRQITEAPKQDAVNAVAMLAHRTSITRQEVENLLQVYGDNYQAYQAIKDISAKHEIYVDASSLEKSLSAIDSEARAVQSWTLTQAEHGNAASDSAIAFRGWLNNITS